MPDLENVIKGLECCTQHGSMCGLDCNGHYEYSEPDHKHIVLVGNYRESCSYGKCETGCVKTLARDALALLKAQEPRVMTYDELVTFDGAFLLESCDILSELDWVFFFDTDSKSDAIWVQGFDGERCVVYREDYGKYARCWTSRPTDAQREAVRWE